MKIYAKKRQIKALKRMLKNYEERLADYDNNIIKGMPTCYLCRIIKSISRNKELRLICAGCVWIEIEGHKCYEHRLGSVRWVSIANFRSGQRNIYSKQMKQFLIIRINEIKQWLKILED